jgi:hypothetical protein
MAVFPKVSKAKENARAIAACVTHDDLVLYFEQAVEQIIIELVPSL